MKVKEKIHLLRKETFTMFPDAKTELEYENNFQLLIAIIMSAQTTDIQVNKANMNLFKVLKTPKDGIHLWEEKIKQYIRTVWFHKNKAKNIFKICNILIKKYNSKLPETIENLIELAWVGIKTAKVFLAVTQNAPYLGVDIHIHRVLNRIWIVKTMTPEQTDKKAEKIFTHKDLGFLHNTLIFFWRYHCTARKPKCKNCPLQKACNYYKKNSSSS